MMSEFFWIFFLIAVQSMFNKILLKIVSGKKLEFTCRLRGLNYSRKIWWFTILELGFVSVCF